MSGSPEKSAFACELAGPRSSAGSAATAAPPGVRLFDPGPAPARAPSLIRRVIGLRLVHLSFTTWLAVALQTVMLALCIFQNRGYVYIGVSRNGAEKIAFILVNYLVTIFFFQAIGLAFRRWPVALRAANVVSLWVLTFMFAWHHFTGEPLDYPMAASNLGEMFHWYSLLAMASCSSPAVLIGMALLFPGLVVLAWLTPWMARWPRPRYAWATAVGSVVVLAAISVSPAAYYHDLTSFGRTAFNYYADSAFIDCPSDYPLVHWGVHGSDNARPAVRPNVFLIMIESFNARFVGRVENGKEVTPFFNKLRTRGLTVDHFYGNSIQTPRGQEAVLLGIPPSYYLKQAKMDPFPHLRSLPAVLKDAGYQTFFFQGHTDLNFDNTGPFQRYLGFDTVLSMGAQSLDATGHVLPQEKDYMWSYWGTQDDRLYQKSFEYLDAHRGAPPSASSDPAPRPCFVTLATITSHMMWDQLPKHRKYIYPDAGDEDYAQNFTNAIALADRCLEAFFTELNKRPWLADSVVIITGDHSYPCGEHDNGFRNEVGFYEDNFRVPLLILAPGIAPRTVTQTAYSQLDIAPTLLDLLGIYVNNHFVGRSMLPESAGQRAIPMAQPYEPYLVIVKYPMKYVFDGKSNREFIYDLSEDPHEDHDLRDQYEGSPLLWDMRRELRTLQINQKLIDRDHVWPAE